MESLWLWKFAAAIIEFLLKLLGIFMPDIRDKLRRRWSLFPQKVAWHPSDEHYGTGLFVWKDDPGAVERDVKWISWNQLKREIERHLLPQVFRSPEGRTVAVRDFLKKREHTVQILDPAGTAIAYIWFGPDPDNDWSRERGLVHIGGGMKHPIVWQTYRRLSHGTYERMSSPFRNYESMPEEMKGDAIEDLARTNERTERGGRVFL